MKLATRVTKIKPSPTLAVTMRAKALQAQGKDIIGFGAGEPDFDTPENIKQAAIQAIQEGFTKYTPVGGIDELKDAIITKLKRDNGLTYRRSQVVVSCGAKHTLYNIAQALFEKGDEVIIPAPYWVSYPDIILLAGAKPVIVNTSSSAGFKLTREKLERAIRKKTRAVIINSPSNPTGATYSLEDLQGLAEVILSKGILAISDDIYEKILYDGLSFHNIANVSDEMKERCIVVNGVSKAYAMTGWRIGYAAGPESIISAVTEMQSQSTSNATSIAQKASVEALAGDQGAVHAMVAAFEKRRDYIVEQLNRIRGISCKKPPGAFYVFPKVSRLYGTGYRDRKISNSVDLSEFLLEEGGVAVVPGSAFGNDLHIRLSYATSMKNIEEGVRRIKAVAEKLK
ncbi:MAG TPA: pyridoxal phosphate-dependent aminotransferase [Syntrophales bacterium]|nr:pyridoxal phosphate-dependent aminotransferase [Syntrophales bacterium]HOX93745.1 pyridoxal phosphate-dependent aminotransferase [Syntrophales bacterium]HPI55886.1 pyridoxal phosphate-dependent aminotransferase [Syntrophales bacterium]HPN23623.1 pyridoxal phosphate-dependent aminotransferase [Syntrophales bacterium]HQM27852.1 pyridoxal phosphate-dependent aminotransferase [Syntrophales bacterium]